MRISSQEAIRLLNEGKVVALPTETVYGLAASLAHLTAIENIFILKGRPSDNPLIVHLARMEEIFDYAVNIPEGFQELARGAWPGPMTLVLPINPEKLPAIVRAGLATAAFRIPLSASSQAVLAETGPLVMPSANISGRPSATKAEHVENDFGMDFPVLDSRMNALGLESTVLIFRENRWQIIRQGAIPAERFKELLGYLPEIKGLIQDETPLCPGQLYRHYAPNAKLILTENFNHVENQVIVGYSDRVYPSSNRVIYFGDSRFSSAIAENLYSTLRQLDLDQIKLAYVDADLPQTGIYRTVIERLLKAAIPN